MPISNHLAITTEVPIRYFADCSSLAFRLFQGIEARAEPINHHAARHRQKIQKPLSGMLADLAPVQDRDELLLLAWVADAIVLNGQLERLPIRVGVYDA